MILTCHVTAPGGDVLYGLVDAAMPIRQLVGCKPSSSRQQLVAQADAEHRALEPREQLFDLFYQRAEIRWITRAVANDDARALRRDR